MAAYLTFDEYFDMGGNLDEDLFDRYEFEAECLINWYTFDRLVNETVLSPKVKMCVYRLIELINEKYDTLNASDPNANTSNPVTGQVASQSNDGVETTYAILSSYNLLTFCKREIEDCINFNLRGALNSLGRNLLYRGYYPGE